MTYLAVKNWQEFQHYNDRNPPWIKLHNSLLDDYEFACLRDPTKLHLIAIWLLASRTENRIPYDAAWIASRISATEELDIASLIKAGFLYEIDSDNQEVGPASTSLAACSKSRVKPASDALSLARSRETETETETETKICRAKGKRTDYPAAFEEAWRLYPKRLGDNPKVRAFKAWNARLREGHSEQEMIDGVARYAAFARAGEKEGTEGIKHTATFFGSDKGFLEPWTIDKNARFTNGKTPPHHPSAGEEFH